MVKSVRTEGSIQFRKKHNFLAPETLLHGLSKKVYPPKLDAPRKMWTALQKRQALVLKILMITLARGTFYTGTRASIF